MDDSTLRTLWFETLRLEESGGEASPHATYKLGEEDSPARKASPPTLHLSEEEEAPSSDEASPADPDAPTYDLLTLIGRGGMGVVHRARQRSLDREVAVKRILSDKANRTVQSRFVSEALVAGGLDHPNIVPVHDLGTTPAGEVFMAMKLVGGTSWKDLLHPDDTIGAPPPPEERRRHLEILLATSNAVAFAHASDIVHRDLKPENVMVGEFGEVLLMDWGLACDVGPDPARSKAPHHTTIVAPAGTPSYMAPELAEGRGRDVGPATDVYLLGAILHEIVTGRPPHEGDDLFAVLRAAVESKTPTFDDSVPEVLRDICRRALAARPGDRFPTVKEFQEELRSYLAHEESLRLTDEATRSLEKLESPGEVPLAERYGVFGDVLSGFTQALHLWPENEAALRGQARAIVLQCDEALDRGDLGLAENLILQLDRNPRGDGPERDRLRAEIRGRKSSRVRALISVVVLGGVIGLVTFFLGELHEESQAKADLEQAKGEAETHLARVWDELRNGEIDGIDELLGKCMERGYLQAIDPGELVRLREARVVSLWSRGEFRRILRRLAPQGRPRSRGRFEEWRAAPALGDTWIGRHLDSFSRLVKDGKKAVYEGPFADPHALVVGAAESGVEREVLAALTEDLCADRSDFRGVESVLYRVAFFAVAGHQGLVPSFSLSAIPFGAKRTASTETSADLVQRSDGSWLGLDPETGARRFLVEGLDAGTAVRWSLPVRDGSVVLGSGAQLVRVDPVDGTILGRLFLPGEVVLGYPDPADRSRLLVLVTIAPRRGWTEVVSVRDGAVEGRQFEVLDSMLARMPTKGAAGDLVERLEDEVGEDELLGSLASEAARDPENPDLLLQWLERVPEADLETRSSLRERILVAPTFGYLDMVRLGTGAERAGDVELASRLYDRAARLFLDQGGNVDLASNWLATPVLFLRQLGGDRFEEGDTERALELVEVGRGFSTFVEMDHEFYWRYSRWLEGKGEGGSERHREIVQRRKSARVEGGLWVLPAGFVVSSDLTLLVCSFVPYVLIAMLLRLWWRARKPRLADLHAGGFRTGPQRLLAFLVRPVFRIKHCFLSYASRGARFLLFLLGLAFVLGLAVFVGNIETVARMAALPASGTPGNAGSTVFARLLQERIEEQGERPGSRRLLAEGCAVRGEIDDARDHLEAALRLDSGDGRSLHNLGVLSEFEGELEAAREIYGRLAGGNGSTAAVARWNLARLRDEERTSADMVHRDRLVADRFPDRPLWARCSAQDLRSSLIRFQGPVSRTAESFLDIATGKMSGYAGVIEGSGHPILNLPERVGIGLNLALLGIAVGALLWLPFPVRAGVGGEKRASHRMSWMRQFRSRFEPLLRLRHILGVAISLLVPGAWDFLYGRIAVGAFLQLVWALAFALRQTILFGGILAAIAAPAVNQGYFPGVRLSAIFPEMAWLGQVGTWVFYGMWVGNVPVTAWRVWGMWRKRRDL